jgi:SPP1 gp7 family putative phage head morphogenesis protein
MQEAVQKGLTQASIRHEVPETLTNALRENIWNFSGMKTYSELKDAAKLLVDENGAIKPFRKWFEDVRDINRKYNVRYLEAEYGFATHSAMMAARWNAFEQDGDEYNLQFRTAGDDLVRASHAALHNTTLPPSDPFWDSYVPPLDWGCRCTVVQVLRDKYPQSDSAEAIQKGEQATTRIGKDGKNRLEMFRFNPGKELKIFPEKHPYFAGNNSTQDMKDAQKTVESMNPETAKADKKETYNAIKELKKSMPEHDGIVYESDMFVTGKMRLLRRSFQDIYEHAIEDENVRQWLKTFDASKMQGWKYAGWAENRPYDKSHPKFDPQNPDRKKHEDTDHFNYYKIEINGQTYWTNVKKNKTWGEVLYTIERDKPEDLITGQKK